jgi:uncharacterized protein
MTATLDSISVAEYLVDNPLFFQEHAVLLGQVKLASPLTGRAISLQERQMEVMRAKYSALELRMADLVRVAHENGAIANTFHAWTQALLQIRNDAQLPANLIDSLKSVFGVPHATLRMWNVAPEHGAGWFVEDVSDDAKLFANGLRAPYCGGNHDFEAVRWLGASESIVSTVILPLRAAGAASAFGLLILGSPDPDRFSASMGTAFLTHIGETASAALRALQA